MQNYTIKIANKIYFFNYKSETIIRSTSRADNTVVAKVLIRTYSQGTYSFVKIENKTFYLTRGFKDMADRVKEAFKDKVITECRSTFELV